LFEGGMMMQNEENKDIRNIPLILDEANYLKDESKEIYDDLNEIYETNEWNHYNEFDGFDVKAKSKSKTIGMVTGVGISSIGFLTFFVAIIFSMMMNNSFTPTVTNPKIEVIHRNTISYSFSFTNPYGISMYCDIENENKESLAKTIIQGYGTFNGEFENLEAGSYTLVVYSAQYGTKAYYYTSDVIKIY
jgi:hypothetical protein